MGLLISRRPRALGGDVGAVQPHWGGCLSRLGVFRAISSFSGSEEFDGAEAGLFQITGLNLFVERSANLAASVRPGRSGDISQRSTPDARATPRSQRRSSSTRRRATRSRMRSERPRTTRRYRSCIRPVDCRVRSRNSTATWVLRRGCRRIPRSCRLARRRSRCASILAGGHDRGGG
jgi:hypothetical protein